MATKNTGSDSEHLQTIYYLNQTICIERQWGRRSITVYVSQDGPLKVRTGLLTPISVIESFLEKKKKWIFKNQNKFAEQKARFPEKKLMNHETFPFLGRSLTFKVVITPGERFFFSRTNDFLQMHIPINEWSADKKWNEHSDQKIKLREFYKREAIQFLTGRVFFWTQQMNVSPTRLSFREPKSRWGSCSSKGSINLNWRLITFSTEIVDYVIIHELCHLVYMNHSSQFWNLVDTFCHNRKQIENDLKKNQNSVQFLDI